MEYEIFTICDNAQNYNGKLVIVGTFDTIFSQSFPLTYDAFSLAVKINCPTNEFKDGTLQVNLKNEKNGEDVCTPITANVPIDKSISSQTLTLVLNFNKVLFTEPGEYFIELKFNGDTRYRKLHLILPKNPQ